MGLPPKKSSPVWRQGAIHPLQRGIKTGEQKHTLLLPPVRVLATKNISLWREYPSRCFGRGEGGLCFGASCPLPSFDLRRNPPSPREGYFIKTIVINSPFLRGLISYFYSLRDIYFRNYEQRCASREVESPSTYIRQIREIVR